MVEATFPSILRISSRYLGRATLAWTTIVKPVRFEAEFDGRNTIGRHLFDGEKNCNDGGYGIFINFFLIN